MIGCPRLLALMLLLPAIAESGFVAAAVRDSAPSGFTVEDSVVVPVSATTAWAALVKDVDAWWPKDHSWWGQESKLTIDARAGGYSPEDLRKLARVVDRVQGLQLGGLANYLKARERQ